MAPPPGDPDPGVVIDSFVVVSDAPAGNTRWAYMGEQIGMSNVVLGPGNLAEDGTLPPDEEEPLPPMEEDPVPPDMTEPNPPDSAIPVAPDASEEQ